MLERYYVRPETVDRIRSSWIYDSVDRYVRWLTEQKYNSRSVFRRIPLVVSFGDFARAHGAESLDVLPRYKNLSSMHGLQSAGGAENPRTGANESAKAFETRSSRCCI